MFIVIFPYILAFISVIIFITQIDHFNLHVITSIVSYALLFASFILSFILNYQRKQLRIHNFNKFINSLPSLQITEKVLFISIYIGFILLTIASVDGLININDIFAEHLLHKTTFVIISWLLLFIVILLRMIFGIRDKTAIFMVQIAFILIIIGYFGTKIALRVLGIV